MSCVAVKEASVTESSHAHGSIAQRKRRNRQLSGGCLRLLRRLQMQKTTLDTEWWINTGSIDNLTCSISLVTNTAQVSIKLAYTTYSRDDFKWSLVLFVYVVHDNRSPRYGTRVDLFRNNTLRTPSPFSVKYSQKLTCSCRPWTHLGWTSPRGGLCRIGPRWKMLLEISQLRYQHH